MYLRLFANASKQCSAKTMMGRSEYSENLFYTGLQQHSSAGLLFCCRTGLQQRNIKLRFQQWSADLDTMRPPVNVAVKQQRIGTINLWRLVYSYVWRNVQSFLHRLFIDGERHSVIPLFK